MACALTLLNSTTGCPDNEGGLQYSYVCKIEDIASITAVSGIITVLAMVTTGLWKKLDYDKDETSYFNQTGERTNEVGSLKYTAEALLKFAGYSAAYKAWADNASDCCKLVFYHVMGNGTYVIQGLEIDIAATGGFTGTKVRDTKITPSSMGGTAAEDSRLEVLIKGKSKIQAPFTSVTPAAIAAL